MLEALEAGTAAIRPGVQGGTVDRASRDVIEKAGFGEEFRHSLGHGIGLQIHEEPRLVKNGKGRLRKNMIVTVEPGIYFDDRAGLRSEDDVLVTATGYDVLTKTPRRLEQMSLRLC